MRAAVEEAHRQSGTIVMCHAENPTAIRMAIEAGVDTIEHGEQLDDELVDLMKERGIILVPTINLIANWHRDFIPVDEPRTTLRTDAFLYRDHYDTLTAHDADRYSRDAVESFQRALASGVRIALGSDTVYEPLTAFGEYSLLEFRALVEHGMTVDQAIVAATSTAAAALGMDHRIGCVRTGYQADLLILRDDPTRSVDVLGDPSNIHLTLCDGIITVAGGRLTY